MAIHVITPGSTGHSTPAGRRSLNLVSSSTLSQVADHAITCKEPDGPYHFSNSLNRTFPFTPPLPASDFPAGESVFAFDCDINLPGGYIWFEVCRTRCLFGDGLESRNFLYLNYTLTFISQIKGEIGSDLKLVFQIFVVVWPGIHPIDLGVFRCSLLDVDKDPCVVNINTKTLVGQTGLFPEQDADPTKLDLCFLVEATLKIPFTKAKHIHFEKCFLTFDKPDDIAIDGLSPEPVLSNSNATTA